MNMLQSELEKLRADVASIKLRDFHLGNLLSDLVTHLAHAHGLDDAATSASEPVESEFVASEPVDNAAENNGEEAGVTTPPKSSKGKK